jgi:membrane protease YdiL (CAAX protease family)
VRPGWYLAAVLAPSIPAVAVTAIYLWRGGHLGSPDIDRVAALPVAAGLSVLVGPLGEELGWRGFLLPRLAERMDLLSASLLVGVVWTFWHAPLFWAPSGSLISGAPVTVQSVAVFVAIVAGLSCLIAWVWHHARGSVVLTILMHLSINMNLLATIFPGAARAQQQMMYAGIVALWLLVLTIIVAERRLWLGRTSGGDVDDVATSS